MGKPKKTIKNFTVSIDCLKYSLGSVCEYPDGFTASWQAVLDNLTTSRTEVVVMEVKGSVDQIKDPVEGAKEDLWTEIGNY